LREMRERERENRRERREKRGQISAGLPPLRRDPQGPTLAMAGRGLFLAIFRYTPNNRKTHSFSG
jgi:hypothetical protein